MKGPSPLLGYNNNVRHKGRVFHIQTEDSGIRHPHVITHLFMDGGRIVKSVKTSYAQHLEDENGHEHVRALMKQQHQAMFRDLRDGKFDYALNPAGGAPASTPTPSSSPGSLPPSSLPQSSTSSASLAAMATSTSQPSLAAVRADEAAAVVVAPPASAVAVAPAASPAPLVAAARLTDPSAQTMPDLRAVRSSAPPFAAPVPVPLPSPPPPRPAPEPAVAAVENEPSAGDPAAFSAIEEYDPDSSFARRRTPVPAGDMPPPPAAMLSKARPDGAYRSQPTPPPPAPSVRVAVAASAPAQASAAPNAARPPAASRPPLGAPAEPARGAPPRRSLFGEDYVSEKSLDEVILSYLAEDLDSDK